MGVVITKTNVPKTCSECPFCERHICNKSGIDIIKDPKKDCPIKILNDIKTKIEQKRSKWDDDGDYSCLVRTGFDIALQVIDKYM